jgi:riboflavin kinase/FMN adenylyltransferase
VTTVSYGLDALGPGERGAAVTIGTFDGVHLGHRALIARTKAAATSNDLDAVIVTWDRHPFATLRPDRIPRLLTTPERRIELLTGTGVDRICVLPFDEELSHWAPERFVQDVLVTGLGARAVYVGQGWRFGHLAKGDVTLLTRMGERLGFDAEAVSLAEAGAEKVSSSRIRRAVAEGDLELAAALLGRPFDLDGVVERGDARGVELGYPTSNLAIDATLAHPPRGVYAGRAGIDATWRGAAINLGVNPTFGGDPETTPPKVEAHLLDFEGDLYGRLLRVEFWKRLRDERRFDSADALVEQMKLDVEETRRLVAVQGSSPGRPSSC